jgi:hypothetical protein
MGRGPRYTPGTYVPYGWKTHGKGWNELDGDCGDEGVSVIDILEMMMRRERENTATAFLCLGLPISVSFILSASCGLLCYEFDGLGGSDGPCYFPQGK